MANKMKAKNCNEGNPKMEKYIVEAPALKKGQKIGTGGVRENGKMVALYSNPVPYVDPILAPKTVKIKENTSTAHYNQQNDVGEMAGKYLLNIVWQEFGEPIFRSVLQRLKTEICSQIEETAWKHTACDNKGCSEIIDVEADEVSPVGYDNDISRATGDDEVSPISDDADDADDAETSPDSDGDEKSPVTSNSKIINFPSQKAL